MFSSYMNALRSRLLLVFVPLLTLATGAGAQWKNVAPNLVAGTEFGGAMQFRDGVIWAGGDNLWRSADLGATWRQSGNFRNASINDIAFFDKQNGLLGTDAQGVFRTTDGGNTWLHVLVAGAISKVSFNGSALMLQALDFSGLFYTSTNGGTNWTTSNVSNGECRSFATARDGASYVQSASIYTNPYTGVVLKSVDQGHTWVAATGVMDGDCHTLAVDSCDAARLYLVNEEIYTPTDSIAQLYLSTDAGTSWQVVDSRHSLFYSGALSTTRDALFVGTLDSVLGTYRSVDRGETWKSIGGPATPRDSRNLAGIDQNTLLAMDASGSIWLTTNGGGDSVSYTGPFDGTVAFSADSLFQGDTLRCDSATLPLYIVDSGCHPPLPQRYTITGPDAASFRVVDQAQDSIAVQFIPGHSGAMNATLDIRLADGSDRSIALAGFSAPPTTLAFDASSLNVKTDTIGGDVWVPIKIDGLSRPEVVELILHYPRPDLVYDGSVDRLGKQVDVPGEVWQGRSKLRILDDTPGTVAAYAHFNVFSDTNYHPQVTFDSVTIPSALSPCSYSLPPAVIATIFPLDSCGDQMLSRWIHLGEVPVLRIQPNPSNGNISISSSRNVGTASVEVMDALGTLRGRFELSLSKAVPSELSLELESGVYYLRVSSRFGEESVPLMIAK